jgi:hypothetical protein
MEFYINGQHFYSIEGNQSIVERLACFKKGIFTTIHIKGAIQANLFTLSYIRKLLKKGGLLKYDLVIQSNLLIKAGFIMSGDGAIKPIYDEEYTKMPSINPWKEEAKQVIKSEPIDESKLITPISVTLNKCEGKTKCENCTCGKLVYIFM